MNDSNKAMPRLKKLPAAPGRQTGSAMVEFFLVASILTPLLLVMPKLAKTADINLATTQAARYGAWEQTVRKKSGEDLATEVSNRFYTAQNTAIQTDQGALLGETNQNAFWGGTGLKARAVITADGAIAVGVRQRSLGGVAGTVESMIDALGDTVGTIVPDSEWDLGGGIYTINVGVSTKSSSATTLEQDSVNCAGEQDTTSSDEQVASCLIHRSAILVDSWSAEGPGQVAKRVRSLVPAGALAPIGDAIAVIGKTLPIFQELEKLDGALGQVKPDILPSDRTGSE